MPLWYIGHFTILVKVRMCSRRIWRAHGMELFEKIELPRGLVVLIWDRSRRIAADTTKVEVEITMPVELKAEYFDSFEDFELVRKVFGPELAFTYRKERTFVHNREKESLVRELIEDFKHDSLPYLARPDFPSRFALSKLSDIKKRPHRYRKYLKKK